MRRREAIRILMECAQRDVTGSGQGYRETSNEWRATVSEAWAVAYKMVYFVAPSENDFFNANMKHPKTKKEPKP